MVGLGQNMQNKTRWIGAAMAFAMLGAQARAEITDAGASGTEAEVMAHASSLPVARNGAPQGNGSRNPDKARHGGDAAAPISYTHRWLMSQELALQGEDWECLRQAVYFEARGQSVQGQFAVAEVVLNRVDSPDYPDSVCGVIRQQADGTCQFSYFCDGLSDSLHEVAAAEIAGRIAAVMLAGGARTLTDGATFFHSSAADPAWAGGLQQTALIGAHVFYAAN